MKPNLTLPLAASYNTRGIIGFTNTVTNAIDQRKINSIYEPVVNAVTKQITLYLAKRPGVTDNTGTLNGTSGQVGYLVCQPAGTLSPVGAVWLFSTSVNDVRVSQGATTTTIVTSAGIAPAYVDKMAVSDVDTVIVQTRNPSTGAQRAWHSTAIATWTEISDSVFTGLSHRGKMEFMDGFAFVLDSTANSIYNSNINTVATWNAQQKIPKQIVQDGSVGLARFGKQLLAFGYETCEVFVNAGRQDGSPLVAVPSKFVRIGLNEQFRTSYTHYYAEVGGRIYFVGSTSVNTASLGAYSYDGERFEKVSTPAIDKILAERNTSLCSVNKIVFAGKEGAAFALDVTTAATQRWLMFFPAWNDWFEWNSTVFTPVNGGIGYFIGVGANQHKIYSLSGTTSNWRDETVDYTWTHQFKMPKKDNATQRLDMFGVKGDTAVTATTSSLNVQFSTDDWQTLTTARAINMTKSKKFLTRCGVFEDLGVRLQHTANLDIRIESAIARIT